MNTDDLGDQGPPPLADGWFVIVDEKKVGPMKLAKLRDLVISGRVTANSDIWRKGMEFWVEAKTVAELADILRHPPINSQPPNQTTTESDALDWWSRIQIVTTLAIATLVTLVMMTAKAMGRLASAALPHIRSFLKWAADTLERITSQIRSRSIGRQKPEQGRTPGLASAGIIMIFCTSAILKFKTAAGTAFASVRQSPPFGKRVGLSLTCVLALFLMFGRGCGETESVQSIEARFEENVTSDLNPKEAEQVVLSFLAEMSDGFSEVFNLMNSESFQGIVGNRNDKSLKAKDAASNLARALEKSMQNAGSRLLPYCSFENEHEEKLRYFKTEDGRHYQSSMADEMITEGWDWHVDAFFSAWTTWQGPRDFEIKSISELLGGRISVCVSWAAQVADPVYHPQATIILTQSDGDWKVSKVPRQYPRDQTYERIQNSEITIYLNPSSFPETRSATDIDVIVTSLVSKHLRQAPDFVAKLHPDWSIGLFGINLGRHEVTVRDRTKDSSERKFVVDVNDASLLDISRETGEFNHEHSFTGYFWWKDGDPDARFDERFIAVEQTMDLIATYLDEVDWKRHPFPPSTTVDMESVDGGAGTRYTDGPVPPTFSKVSNPWKGANGEYFPHDLFSQNGDAAIRYYVINSADGRHQLYVIWSMGPDGKYDLTLDKIDVKNIGPTLSQSAHDPATGDAGNGDIIYLEQSPRLIPPVHPITRTTQSR